MNVEFTPASAPFGSAHPALRTEDEIRQEPMIYGGSWDWCRDNAGPLTQQVMDLIEDDVKEEILPHARRGYHPVIDTKSVLLMPGQYPCIPGWHCDGVIRTRRGGQPNLCTLDDEVLHYICSMGDSIEHQGTELAMDRQVLDVDPDNVWGSVDAQVAGRSTKLLSGEVAKFRRSQLHRGLPATARGWRYFFRMSFYHMPAVNEIRQQVQIYTDVAQGW